MKLIRKMFERNVKCFMNSSIVNPYPVESYLHAVLAICHARYVYSWMSFFLFQVLIHVPSYKHVYRRLKMTYQVTHITNGTYIKDRLYTRESKVEASHLGIVFHSVKSRSVLYVKNQRTMKLKIVSKSRKS